MIKIDSNCVYVPIEYEGKTIVIVEAGKSVDDHHSQSQIKTPVRYDNYTAWGNHQGKAKYGVEYDIYQWSPRKYIGRAKYGSDNYSSSSTDYEPEKKGCLSVIWKIIKWIFIIFIIIIVLALIFGD